MPHATAVWSFATQLQKINTDPRTRWSQHHLQGNEYTSPTPEPGSPGGAGVLRIGADTGKMDAAAGVTHRVNSCNMPCSASRTELVGVVVLCGRRNRIILKKCDKHFKCTGVSRFKHLRHMYVDGFMMPMNFSKTE